MRVTATIATIRADGRVVGDLHALDPVLRRAVCAGMVLGIRAKGTLVGYVTRDLALDPRGRRPEPCGVCLERAPAAWRRWFRRTGRVGRPPKTDGAKLRNDFLNAALPEQRASGAPAPQHRWCSNCKRTGRIQIDPQGPEVKCGRCDGRGIITIRLRRKTA